MENYLFFSKGRDSIFNKLCFCFLIGYVSLTGNIKKTSTIKVICLSRNDDTQLDKYEIEGNLYTHFELVAKEFEGYTLVGKNYRNLIFGIDDEVILIYSKNAISQNNIKSHKKYISGYPDGNFYPNKKITWAEAIFMLYNIDELKEETLKQNNNWYDNALKFFYNKNIIDKDKFMPNSLISKNDFKQLAINFIDRTANKELIDAFLQFGTIDKSSYISRGESVFIINKLLGRDKIIASKPTFKNIYKDVTTDNLYYNEIIESSINHDYIDFDETERWLSVYN